MTPYLHTARVVGGNLKASLYIDTDYRGQPKGTAAATITRDGIIIHQHDVDRTFNEDTARQYCHALLKQHQGEQPMADPADPKKPPLAARAPDAGFPVSGRTVEITGEDENIVAAFVPVDPKTPCNR